MSAGEMTVEQTERVVRVGEATATTRRTKVRHAKAADVKSDGQGGQPSPVVEARVPVTAGGPNAAAKEAPKPGFEVDPNHPARARGLAVADAEAGVVTGGTRKRIAVCGFASSSREMVPVGDPNWEVWGLNQLYRYIPRADRWFDIHYFWDEEVVDGTGGGWEDPASYRHWLAHCGMPVYMHHTVPEIPTSVRYPLEGLVQRHGADYFTSTIAFMVVLAIDEIDGRVRRELQEFVRRTSKRQLEEMDLLEVKKRLYGEYAIGVFGVDLIVGDEYFHQKACAEFWLGEANARGINVVLPPTTALCKQLYRYGYEKEPETIIKLSEIESHSLALSKERDEHLKALYCIDGGLQVDGYWRELLTLRMRGLGQGVATPAAPLTPPKA